MFKRMIEAYKEWCRTVNEPTFYLMEGRYVDYKITPVIYMRGGGEMTDVERYGFKWLRGLTWNEDLPHGYSDIEDNYYVRRQLVRKTPYTRSVIREATFKLYGWQVIKLATLGDYPEGWSDFWEEYGLYFGVQEEYNKKYKEVSL